MLKYKKKVYIISFKYTCKSILVENTFPALSDYKKASEQHKHILLLL